MPIILMEASSVCQAGAIQEARSVETSRHLLNTACHFALLISSSYCLLPTTTYIKSLPLNKASQKGNKVLKGLFVIYLLSSERSGF